ncbi:MAG: hypothetical protein HYZ86_00810 [Candidatus Omnitrophica bacterium]|nr:hypothetical protein [Candidatus Omnitrophota bacterium]
MKAAGGLVVLVLLAAGCRSVPSVDPEASSAFEAISGAFTQRPGDVKYCPVDGTRVSGHLTKCPRCGAALKPVQFQRGYFDDIAFPLWFVVAIISRDVILLVGSMIIQFTTGRLEIQPNRSGKFTAFLQILCVLGIFLQLRFTVVFWYAALAATMVSGIIYIKEGIKTINGTPANPVGRP